MECNGNVMDVRNVNGNLINWTLGNVDPPRTRFPHFTGGEVRREGSVDT